MSELATVKCNLCEEFYKPNAVHECVANSQQEEITKLQQKIECLELAYKGAKIKSSQLQQNLTLAIEAIQDFDICSTCSTCESNMKHKEQTLTKIREGKV